MIDSIGYIYAFNNKYIDISKKSKRTKVRLIKSMVISTEPLIKKFSVERSLKYFN